MIEEKNEINKYLLKGNVVNKYDMIKTKENVMLLLNEYVRLQCKYLEILPPKVTYNYEILGNYNKNHNFDKTTSYLDKKMETENEIKAFYFEIQKVLKNMTKREVIVFNYLLLKGNSEESVCEKIEISRTGLRPIKFSCILKIALAFNLEVAK